MTSYKYIPPKFWSFPPFFTIQPAQITKNKQLSLWKSIIMDYHQSIGSFIFIPSKFEYFENSDINRSLNEEGRQEVVKYLVENKFAEWDTSHTSHTKLRLLLKSPELLANEIYTWVSTEGFLGNVFTIYELHSGEQYKNTGFFESDPIIMRRSLEILEKEGKCILLLGSNQDEHGVKFL